MRVLTVLGIQQLAQGAAMVGSVLRQHPGADVGVVVTGADAELPQIHGATVSSLGKEALSHLPMLASQFDTIGLNRVLAGDILASEVKQHEEVVFIDPSMTLIGSLNPVLEALRTVPVVIASRADDCVEGPAGELYPGFVALRQGSQADELLASWPKSSGAAELRERDPYRPTDALESWFARIPDRLGTAVAVLPGAIGGIVEPDSPNSGSNDAAPPILFDWGELDPHEPHDVLKGAVTASSGLELTSLLRPYLEDMRLASPKTKMPARFEMLPDGTRFDRLLGSLAGTAISEGVLTEPVFEASGMHQLYGWLKAPSNWGEGVTGLTRYHEAIWASSAELMDAYPDPQEADAQGYADWLAVHGTHRLGMAAELLPPTPDFVANAKPEARPEQEVVREAPERPLEGAVPARPDWGVNVAGFFTSELGLGEAARLLVSGLDAAGVPCAPVQGELAPPSRQQARFEFVEPAAAPYPVTIVCVNGDGIPIFAEEVGEAFFDERYTIALWWWETDRIPDDWKPAFDVIDEVWVASDLIYEAVKPVSPVPVTRIPLPVDVPPRVLPSRRELGMPPGFVFLFVFDYHSTVARKNPQGVIEAFRKAFPPGSGASLVVKSINAANRPWEHADVLNAAGGHPDIHFIDAYVTPEERDGLMARCDCYVTLHRSEGFGLTAAEAMWFSKPVIATRYGGVLEFLNDENAYLVPATESRVGENAAPYPPDGVWVTPDLDAAAATMREVFENQAGASAKGRHGAAGIRSHHSPQAAGEAIASRLREIYEMLPDKTQMPAQDLPPLDARGLPERLASQPPVRGNPITRALRKMLRKLAGPDMERQLGTDRDLLATVEGLDARVRTVTAELERTQRTARAESLGEARNLGKAIRDLNAHVADLQRLREEHRSLPVVSEEYVLESWSEPGAGQVEGYRAGGEPAEGQAAFADAFRGDEDRVRELQRCYLDLLAGSGPLLDIGCGRGEMLDLLSDAGIRATGVDPDAAMVARARAKGHEVELEDALSALEALPDGSLGAIFSAQVIEHILADELERLVELSRAKLRPDGLFIAETVNPHCVNALKAFWVDPTHKHPLFPETMLQMLRTAGFESAYVFHPNASGNVSEDRFTAPAYAIVGRAGD